MAFLLSLTALLFWSSATRAWEYEWPSDWDGKWNDRMPQHLLKDNCKVSHLNAFEMSKTKDPVFFSSGGIDNFIAPKILPLNGTAGEQWEFDGTSADAKQAFVFGFYRDPNYAILGTGNLRVSVEMAYPNGTRFAQVDYPSSSTIEECSWGTRGSWKHTDYSYTFEVSADYSRARVALDTPSAKGVVVLDSLTRPRYPDGKLYPSDNSTSEALPYFHFVEPIPVGKVDVSLQIQGHPYVWSGIGGMERLWGAFSWFTCLQGMNVVRSLSGPYALSLLSFTSNIKKGGEYPSVILFDEGEKVFASQRTQESATEDYFTFTKTYGGEVTGALKDKVSGYELELVSPSRMKHYTFMIEHKNVAFEYILGGGHGGSGFSGEVTGGRVGLEQYKGIVMTEALTFPPRSPLFKAQYSEE